MSDDDTQETPGFADKYTKADHGETDMHQLSGNFLIGYDDASVRQKLVQFDFSSGSRPILTFDNLETHGCRPQL